MCKMFVWLFITAIQTRKYTGQRHPETCNVRLLTIYVISIGLLVKWESAAAEITKSGIGSSRRVRASELALDALSALQNCIMVILNLYDKLFCNHVRIKQYFSKYAQFFWLRALTERTLFSEAMWTTQKKPQQTWVNSFVLIIYSQYNVKLAEWWEK